MAPDFYHPFSYNYFGHWYPEGNQPLQSTYGIIDTFYYLVHNCSSSLPTLKTSEIFSGKHKKWTISFDDTFHIVKIFMLWQIPDRSSYEGGRFIFGPQLLASIDLSGRETCGRNHCFPGDNREEGRKTIKLMEYMLPRYASSDLLLEVRHHNFLKFSSASKIAQKISIYVLFRICPFKPSQRMYAWWSGN